MGLTQLASPPTAGRLSVWLLSTYYLADKQELSVAPSFPQYPHSLKSDIFTLYLLLKYVSSDLYHPSLHYIIITVIISVCAIFAVDV